MGFIEKLSGEFFYRMVLDVVFIAVLVRLIYYRNYRKSDLVFTFFMFNIVIFIITYLMNNVQISLGAAFGLFAVFSMLRYRTEDISAKDMTYLFIVIAIGLICAIAKENYTELALLNSFIVGLTFLLDGNFLFRSERQKVIDSIELELIKPENRAKLLQHLKDTTGFNVHRIVVTRISLSKHSAVVKAYYYDGE